jgi:hypothetical protein
MQMNGITKLSGNIVSGNGTDWSGTYQLTETLANDATPSVKNVRYAKTGGTTTITAFDDPHEGQILSLVAFHAITITHGTSTNQPRLDGAANFVMASGDRLILEYTSGSWREVTRALNT